MGMEIVNKLINEPSKKEGVICALQCVVNGKFYVFFKNHNYKKGIKLMVNALKGNRFDDRNKQLQEDFLKYGENNFKCIIFEVVGNDVKKYSVVRKRYIKTYDSIENGYNKKENCFLFESQRKLMDKNRKRKTRKMEKEKEKKREIEKVGGYSRWYYLKNREKLIEQYKKYYREHKESCNIHYRIYREKSKMYDKLEKKLGKDFIASVLEVGK